MLTIFQRAPMSDFMKNVTVFDHPLIQHKVTIIRDVKTGPKEFRELLSEISSLMLFEATRDLETEPVRVQTPLAEADGVRISGKKLALVPILRAGLGMVDAALKLIPVAKVGHIGLYRDHETCKPVRYYCKMPDDIKDRDVFIVDPMLATGGSVKASIDILMDEFGCSEERIKVLCLIGCPPGVKLVHDAHPNVHIYIAHMDDVLDERNYILPGLGDAGDRIYGTK